MEENLELQLKKENKMKKFEMTTEFKIFAGRKLFKIKALVSFRDVKKGDFGGYIETEKNLSQDGDAWIYGNAQVYDNARIDGNAIIGGNAKVCGEAKICSEADYVIIKGFGSKFRCTTFFRLKNDDIGTKCGCFYGTLDEFRNKVVETHNQTKLAKEYLIIADLIAKHFEKKER